MAASEGYPLLQRVIRGDRNARGRSWERGRSRGGGPAARRACPPRSALPCVPPASSQGIAAPAPGPCLWRACDRDGSSSSSGTLPRQVGQEPRQVGQEPKEPKMQTSFSTTLSSLSSACACACLPQPAVCVGEYAETTTVKGTRVVSCLHLHNIPTTVTAIAKRQPFRQLT